MQDYDFEKIKDFVDAYIETHYDPNSADDDFLLQQKINYAGIISFAVAPALAPVFKFKPEGETFSKMLRRLIAESGEKNSDIYTRANIKRQHFSKMMNDDEYQPSKPTVLAFAIALKLGFEKTRELLASAGYVLTRNKYFDVIVAAFIERNLYDIDLINYTLHEYDQQLLGYF